MRCKIWFSRERLCLLGISISEYSDIAFLEGRFDCHFRLQALVPFGCATLLFLFAKLLKSLCEKACVCASHSSAIALRRGRVEFSNKKRLRKYQKTFSPLFSSVFNRKFYSSMKIILVQKLMFIKWSMSFTVLR